jgi:PAS domain S-box-containing protein
MEEALRTGKPVHNVECIIERPDGTRLVALANVEPMLDRHGRVEGAINCLQDITERKATEDRLRTSEVFLQGIIATTPECIKIVGRDGSLLHMNAAGLQMIEASSEEVVQGACTFDLIAPEHRDVWRENHNRVCDGESRTWEFDIIGLSGTRRHMETHAAPLRTPEGTVCQLAVTRDITQRKISEQALRDSERHWRELLEALPAAVYTTDVEGRITFFNQAAVELWGHRPTLGESEWCGSWKLFWPDGSPLPHDQCPMAIALREDRIVRNVEAIAERPQGSRIPFTPYPTPLHDASGALTGAINMLVDISFHKEAAARQRLLINELNHRVKNSLASVQAIVSQTLRGASDLTTGRKAAEQRLVALARAHDVLTAEAWQSARMRDVVCSSLVGYCTRGDRLEIEGPEVRLTPKAALAIAMALHELCTNALKYGALSGDNGRVSVCWSVEGDKTGRCLSIAWEERGGPTVVRPTAAGFGTRLIEWGLAGELGGEAQLLFPPDGAACHIRVPLLQTAV